MFLGFSMCYCQQALTLSLASIVPSCYPIPTNTMSICLMVWIYAARPRRIKHGLLHFYGTGFIQPKFIPFMHVGFGAKITRVIKHDIGPFLKLAISSNRTTIRNKEQGSYLVLYLIQIVKQQLPCVLFCIVVSSGTLPQSLITLVETPDLKYTLLYTNSVATTTAEPRNWATFDPAATGKKWELRFADPITFNGLTGNWAT